MTHESSPESSHIMRHALLRQVVRGMGHHDSCDEVIHVCSPHLHPNESCGPPGTHPPPPSLTCAVQRATRYPPPIISPVQSHEPPGTQPPPSWPPQCCTAVRGAACWGSTARCCPPPPPAPSLERTVKAGSPHLQGEPGAASAGGGRMMWVQVRAA